MLFQISDLFLVYVYFKHYIISQETSIGSFKQKRTVVKHISKDLIPLFFPMGISVFKLTAPLFFMSLVPHRKRKYSWTLQT